MVTLFGSTINETWEALKPEHLGKKQPEGKTKAIGRIIITIALMLFCVFLYKNNGVKEANIIIGAIVGYWIK